jgi:hypothetical protein
MERHIEIELCEPQPFIFGANGCQLARPQNDEGRNDLPEAGRSLK